MNTPSATETATATSTAKAAALPARAAAAVEATHLRHGHLSFRLGDEEYAVDLLQVQEIRRFSAHTRLAFVPDCVSGVMNLRGLIVPVVDLRRRLGLAPVPTDGDTSTIVVKVAGRLTGVVVDAVCDVVTIAQGQAVVAASVAADVDARLVTGLAEVDGRMLILVDMTHVLPDLGPPAAADGPAR
jgi:purine-binding chemotaxis protein CheW